MFRRILILMIAVVAIPTQAFGMTAIAHRGADTSKVDENTIAALERAYDLGAWVEGDVFLTKDGKPIVIHDADLDKTTNCTGPVADKTAKYIRNNCHTEHGDDVPTFKEYVKALAANKGQRLNMEVKGRGWFIEKAAKIVKLRNIADNAGVLKRVYFSEDATTRTLEAFRDYAPDARTCWKPGNDEVSAKTAKKFSVNVIMAFPSYWTRDRVNTIKSKGFKTWARQVNTKDEWKHMKKIGIGASLTDHPSWS